MLREYWSDEYQVYVGGGTAGLYDEHTDVLYGGGGNDKIWAQNPGDIERFDDRGYYFNDEGNFITVNDELFERGT